MEGKTVGFRDIALSAISIPQKFLEARKALSLLLWFPSTDPVIALEV